MKLLSALLLIITTSVLLHAQNKDEKIPISRTDITFDESNPIFFIVEEMPVFKYKDCRTTNESFLRYVADSIRFPSENCFGKVYVQFVIKPDSTLDNVKILRGLENCEGYKEEVERIILSMPKWIPGKQRGKEVRVMMTMPIDFHPNE